MSADQTTGLPDGPVILPEPRRNPAHAEHYALYDRRTVLPTDYTTHGGQVDRDDTEYGADCSCGCRWARWLEGDLGGDWCVCARPDGPRFGLLTFEHQAGACYQPKERKRRGK